MSSFTMKLKHKASGEYHSIWAIDDYFAHHVYGYKLPDGTVVKDVELMKLYYEREFKDE